MGADAGVAPPETLGEEGVWERIWRTALAALDLHGKLDWSLAFLDGSVERSFAWLGNCRRLLIRWERLFAVYASWFAVAVMQMCIRRLI
jgi:hypothetical protein